MGIRNALIGMAAITVAAGAFALPPGEPPPPQLNDCSPGFWKNHQELWDNEYCEDAACVMDAMAMLTARGKGSGDIRQEMANILNAWADSFYGKLVCTD